MRLLIVVLTVAVLSACSSVSENSFPGPGKSPLLESWQGEYGGTPDFERMQINNLKPAFEIAMAQNLAEIESIANNTAPASFENTIIPLERAGPELDRLFTYYSVWGSNVSSAEFRQVQQEMAPVLSAYFSKITQNEKLFKRVKKVYDDSLVTPLDSDQQRLVLLTYDGFASNGATLEGDARQRYASINEELAELHTRFANNLLADEEGYVTYLNADQLDGLPDALIKSAKVADDEPEHQGQYAIRNTRSSMDPFLTFSTERDLRKKVWETYYSRGDNGTEYDNNDIIARILALRHERVQLLGYPNYASWRLENRMAKTPARAKALMDAVWPAALARVQLEVADMQAIADAEGAGISIEPWDYRFYAEKVRLQRYELDSNDVKQYLQLDNLTQALFYVAGELFGFEFKPVPDGTVPVFHEDVKVWEVSNRASGEHVGLWYLDPFARKGKRSGAWASSYRSHSTFDGKRTVLSSNNSNFIKPADGEPVLISWDDAETFFHEFGHALHSLASNVRYPGLNGGIRDYTEFQSQLLERWLSTDQVINRFLRHHETGDVIPAELIAKIKQASTFNQGFATTEYLASALMDMAYHTIDPKGLDVDSFERETLASMNMPDEIVMRHRSPQFAHIFSGEGYSAGYYGYLWADVLTADAAEAFADAPGGFYDQEVAARLVKYLFAPRNAMDPDQAYRSFRGRDADIDALMRDRGFPASGSIK